MKPIATELYCGSAREPSTPKGGRTRGRSEAERLDGNDHSAKTEGRDGQLLHRTRTITHHLNPIVNCGGAGGFP